MRKTTITCNLCGKELERNGYISLNIDATSRPYSNREYENDYLNVDLCPDCAKKTLGFLNVEPDYFEKTR